MDKHFVCQQCHGVSLEAKNCSTEGCSLQGQALQQCDCQDGKHGK